MKILHCADNRADDTKVFLQTADGKFKYQLFMDYAKGMPENLKLIPFEGNISSGCCDKDDNLYAGYRGGPNLPECLIKLDPDGNFVDTIGMGVISGLHFFCCTDHDTIALTNTPASCTYEVTMDASKVVKTCGKPFDVCENNRRNDHYTIVRKHYGIFATEPYEGFRGDNFSAMLGYNAAEMGGPFRNVNGVTQDPFGNYFVSDGYGNVAVHKFDKDWNLIKSWGGKGTFDPYTDTPGQFLVPHGICADPNGNVWLCDREKDAIHIFDNDGNLLAYCSHNMGQPSGIDHDGKYMYVVGRGGYVTIFDFDFHIVGELGVFNGNLRAHGLAADSKGNLYLFPTHANYEHQIIALKRV